MGGGGPTVAATSSENYQWAYSIMDSSRVSTFFISILLIVYGSFRSLALEEDKEGILLPEQWEWPLKLWMCFFRRKRDQGGERVFKRVRNTNVGLFASHVSSIGSLHIASRHVLLLRLDANAVCHLYCGHRNSCSGLLTSPDVSVFNATLWQEKQDLARILRPIHLR